MSSCVPNEPLADAQAFKRMINCVHSEYDSQMDNSNREDSWLHIHYRCGNTYHKHCLINTQAIVLSVFVFNLHFGVNKFLVLC